MAAAGTVATSGTVDRHSSPVMAHDDAVRDGEQEDGARAWGNSVQRVRVHARAGTAAGTVETGNTADDAG